MLHAGRQDRPKDLVTQDQLTALKSSVSYVELSPSSAPQTTFTVPSGYTIGPASPRVWFNGALLEAAEYTATDGTTVSLTKAAAATTDKLAVMSINSLTMMSPTSSVGDVLFSTSNVAPANFVLPATIYTQATYPALYGQVGIIEDKNELATRTTVTPWATATTSSINSTVSGQSKVLIAVGTTTSTGLGVGRRSTDGGATWTNIATLTGTGIPALGQLATDGAGVWVVTVTGGARVYRSTDNGLTFTAIYPSTFAACRAIDTDKKGVWLACTDTGSSVYRSTDNGATWALAGTTAGAVPVDTLVSDGNAAWFTTGATYAGVGASYDVGATWTMTVSCTAPATTVFSNLGMTIAVCPGLGTLLTTDTGITWRTINAEGARGGGAGVIITAEGTIAIYSGPYLRLSYDRGETWASSRVTTYGAMFPISRTFDSDGNCLARSDKTTADTAVYYRLSRGTNYNTSTQFKTPTVKATKGTYAYIRALLGS